MTEAKARTPGEPSLGRVTPCAGCPWRVTSRRGYLGADDPVHFYRASITREGMMPCHEEIDYSDPEWRVTQFPFVSLCAGGLIHFVNTLKAPRYAPLARAVAAVKRSRAVFTWPQEFLRHHMPGATEEEVTRAVRLAAELLPAGDENEGDHE